MSLKKSALNESAKATVARLKANRSQPSQAQSDEKAVMGNSASNSPVAQRVSKNKTSVNAAERKNVANQIIKQLLFGELTQGQALKALRINVLGMKQDVYAKLVDISRKTLSDIENDRGSYKTDILNKAFKPFGLKVGLLPSSTNALRLLLQSN
ncbi:transcriptional regulator [Enterovibrio norvegicus FF-33]|uniref:helix-turn-helix transcriptional regulator n=1 Tax=Enterovibrio norvegicus TaxID=188144 RepID=UPI0003144E02|nr:helix-turn-helix transcriptional regulator [Enterovibrio norvegicus]OEE69817.1 transcriptional regulator [Enterovibrio norvegicus FF-33]